MKYHLPLSTLWLVISPNLPSTNRGVKNVKNVNISGLCKEIFESS